MVGMPSPNLLRAINPKHNPTQETLECLLKPFGLRIGLAQIKQRRRGRAAWRCLPALPKVPLFRSGRIRKPRGRSKR